MNYRPEIDGLRAVAVLAVIIFHAGVPYISGGFVGVDVFFVISGYLITSIIAMELDKKEFSIVRFYERRARRILPALFVVLAITSITASFIMLPFELKVYGESLLGVIFFVSNFTFWQQSGYFAPAAELNPLLHTWSLAVEEQFYIIFPIVLAVLWRWRRHFVFIILLLTALGSLMLADMLSSRAPSANFYLLPTRVWELLVGALIALWLMYRPQPTGLSAELLAGGGLVLVGASLFLFNAATPFPSLYALIPVLGAGAIILAAQPETITGKLLSWRPMVAVGLISYSAYLWHQPLFAFARIFAQNNQPPLSLMLGLAITALILAWFSWAIIEQPFRNKRRFTPRWVFSASGIGCLATVILGVAIISSGGFIKLVPEDKRSIVEKSNLEYGEYVSAAYREINQSIVTNSELRLVIVGDSFSQDFYNVIHEYDAFSNYGHSAIYIPARCQIYYGKPFSDVKQYIDEADHQLCEVRSLGVEDVEHIKQADVVIFAARWQEWSAEMLQDSILEMRLDKGQKVFVVGPKIFEPNRRQLLSIYDEYGVDYRRPVDPQVRKINDALNKSNPNYIYINIIEKVCDSGCPLFTPSGNLISYDGLHFTREGAQLVARSIFTDAPLVEFAQNSMIEPEIVSK